MDPTFNGISPKKSTIDSSPTWSIERFNKPRGNALRKRNTSLRLVSGDSQIKQIGSDRYSSR